tara:strand:- start:1313 stop:1696 length:384 start_codon:yes stop_codon:yes gene_type:complete
MGFNSTILILNDYLHNIESEETFGARVAEQLSLHGGGRDDRSNDFKVVAQHHADNTGIILVGGNTSKIIGFTPGGSGKWALESEEGDKDVIRVLRETAANYGYRLSKIPDNQRSKWRKPYRGRGLVF